MRSAWMEKGGVSDTAPVASRVVRATVAGNRVIHAIPLRMVEDVESFGPELK